MLALFVLFPAPEMVLAQKDSPDIPSVSSVVAIQNARVVQAPGRVIEEATVVFRDGVITAVGKRVDPPYDARLIDGTGLTVYAGLIDALSHAGIPEPRGGGAPEAVPDRSNPPFDRAGITPEKTAREALDPSEATVKALRNFGYTAVLSAPRTGMLPGQASLALLAGNEGTDMVVPGPDPMFFQFQGARGVYPGTPMGIMSQFRQLYREADRRMKLDTMYAANPSGLPRPPYDAVHEAFYPVVAGKRAVVAWTTDALEVHRALKLADELGFSLILAGLNGGFDTVTDVAAAGTPVILTLDLPEKPEWSAALKADSLQQILDGYDDETRTATFRDVEAEKRTLEGRQLWSRARFVGTAAQFEKAGIPFAFSTKGLEAKDLASNVQAMLEAGLSQEAMLAAFTTHAATLLGVSDMMGSVEPGKMANLVITDGELFGKETQIKMVFVNGHVFEPEAPRARRGNNGGEAGNGGNETN
jgi:imidazolonepropionase-like amidohydrolase